MYIYVYMYIYIYIYTHTYTPVNANAIVSIVRLPHPWSGDSQGQETFLAPSADKQTRNYDTVLKPPSFHSVHWGINPPPLFLAKTPFKLANPLYWFFVTSPIKVESFSEPPKY